MKKSTSSFKFYSWNINGLRAILKKGEFQKFILKYQPDILCLQETRLNSSVEIPFKAYTYWNFADKKGYSGTLSATKIEPLAVFYGISNKEFDSEGRVITLEFNHFFLVNVYVPNAGRDLNRLSFRQRWDMAFLNYIKALDSKKPVIICGDFNVAHKEIDLKNPKANMNNAGFTNEEREDFQKFIDNGFIDSFREFNKEGGNYTWWSYRFNARARDIGWRIDYFLISMRLRPNLKSAEILSDVYGSDHCPVNVRVDF